MLTELNDLCNLMNTCAAQVAYIINSKALVFVPLIKIIWEPNLMMKFTRETVSYLAPFEREN